MPIQLQLKLFISIFSIIFSSSSVFAETQWELGAGLVHFSANSYVGSDDVISINAPIPYFKLKTDLFDMNKSNIKMNWFKETPFSFNVNYDFSLPVISKDTLLRQGMEDLDSVLKIGPMLSYQFSSSKSSHWKLEFPFLNAFKVNDSGLESIGWTFLPRVSAKFIFKLNQSPLGLTWSLGPVYGNNDYHQFYYSIDSIDVTPNRKKYLAQEGYAGYRMNFSMTKKINDLWFGIYLRHQNLSGAVFSDSPLVNKRDYLLVTFGMVWVFAGNMK